MLYRITNITNVLGQMDWYQTEPIYTTHLRLRAENGNRYNISVSNEGQLLVNSVVETV